MAYWFAYVEYSHPQDGSGASDWAVEAETQAQARTLIDIELTRTSRELTSAKITELDRANPEHAVISDGLGLSFVVREGPPRGLKDARSAVQLNTERFETAAPPARSWITDGMWDALFEPQDGAQVFALLEAETWPDGPEALAAACAKANLEAVCLFDLEKGSEFEATAPWLIQLSLAPGDQARDMPPSPVHNALFANRELTSRCLFLRATSDIATLRGNMRRLTRIKDYNDRWYYCRFWEPEFFMYFALFLRGRRLAAPLGDVTSFAILVQEALITAQTDLRGCAHGPDDRLGDLDLLFDAGTALVSLRHARALEATHDKGCKPMDVYRLAKARMGLQGMDYQFVKKCTDIAYVAHHYFGAQAPARLNDDLIAQCFDDTGDVRLFIETLHGQCMFGLLHDISPDLLRGSVRF